MALSGERIAPAQAKARGIENSRFRGLLLWPTGPVYSERCALRLRPPLATERLLPGPDGLVRIALKKPFSDGTVADDLDPLSLLCRLLALVPAPRFHTVRYFGVLSAASKWRPLIVPSHRLATQPTTLPTPAPKRRAAPLLRARPARATAHGRSCSRGPSRSTSIPVPAAVTACACSPSSPTCEAPPASCVTAASLPSHPLELHPETHPTSRPSSSDADNQPRPLRSRSCSRNTEHRPFGKPAARRSLAPRPAPRPSFALRGVLRGADEPPSASLTALRAPPVATPIHRPPPINLPTCRGDELGWMRQLEQAHPFRSESRAHARQLREHCIFGQQVAGRAPARFHAITTPRVPFPSRCVVLRRVSITGRETCNVPPPDGNCWLGFRFLRRSGAK